MEKVKMNIIMKQLNLRLNDNKTFCIMLGFKKKVKWLAESVKAIIHATDGKIKSASKFNAKYLLF